MNKAPDQQLVNALIHENFRVFLRFAYEEMNGGRAYMHNWHIDAIIHQLDRVMRGDNRRLIVTIPPRHLKTVTISIAWVAWMLGRNPALRFMCASYGAELAESFARECLRLMTTDWYRRAFPSLKLIQRKLAHFQTSAGGGRLSTSVDGIGTGFGADFIIIDDPMKANFATSEAERDATKNWFDTSMRSRFDDQAKGAFIVVAQRLHEADLPGQLMAMDGTPWFNLKLPAIATHDELIPLTDGRYHQRREGHALHEARLSLATLNEKKAENPFVFEPQWQQNPLPSIGPFVNPGWFQYYDEAPQVGVTVLSLDTAVGTTVRNDWSVGIVARFYQGRFYILDIFRARVTFSKLEAAVFAKCQDHGVDRLLIENASSGQQLIQRLREGPPPGVPYPISIQSSVDKITRFEAQASKIEAGMIVLPRTAPWLGAFLAEVVGFPNARFDDQADALAQMLANPPLQLPRVENEGPEVISSDDPDPCIDPDIDPWA